jgi:hypothetical protein
MIRHLTTWHAAAFTAALAGITVGPELPRELVLVVPPVLVAGFVLGYVSAVRETRAAAQRQ